MYFILEESMEAEKILLLFLISPFQIKNTIYFTHHLNSFLVCFKSQNLSLPPRDKYKKN